jgi:trehalose 6-phosphate synthase
MVKKMSIKQIKTSRSLPLALRFVIPLIVVMTLLAYLLVPLVDRMTLKWSVRDLDVRSRLITSAFNEPLGELLMQGNKAKISNLISRIIQDERLYALGYCDETKKLLYHTKNFPEALGCSLPGTSIYESPALLQLPHGLVHVAINPVAIDGISYGWLILVHDMSFVQRRSEDTRKYIVIFFAVLCLVVSLITVLIAHLSWRGWMTGVRSFLRGDGAATSLNESSRSELQPLVGDLKALLRAVDAEKRLTDDLTFTWDPDTLRSLLHKQLAGEQIIVVSNREPYIHMKIAEGNKVLRPASGLVTAVEPVMRACSGTWIAHGSGTADRDVVDKKDRVQVPPNRPEYTLRRIWLTKEEEQGYYYGFANEGIWPLCHIAHVRPVFRTSDWLQYVAINKRFAAAVIEEADRDDPVVLVQDYHFALLPDMIRRAMPRATVITFWHIPWPNPELFGICPWREELLKGMLGGTIIGFHTPFHCRNFLETVDRYLEARVNNASSTIVRRGSLTLVEAYPISIRFPPAGRDRQPDIARCRDYVCKTMNIREHCQVGLGVDRLDYTKGIIERLRAVECMLENHPEMVGQFCFIQIAAPSRSTLDEYKAFEARVRALAQQINEKFSAPGYLPVHLKVEHHDPEEVNLYYRAADVCMVTSLHDGMNLVAKEYVAARDDERGALVLSRFTGASHELYEALIVNPYHIEQTADALYQALNMPVFEQQARMRSMRSMVSDFNVYRWAARMLLDAARVRQRERLADSIGVQL